eukprot:scaffold30695_cov61-Phaeocystis_antarctica.AAC.2
MRLPAKHGPGSDCSLRCSASGASSQHWLLSRWGPAIHLPTYFVQAESDVARGCLEWCRRIVGEVGILESRETTETDHLSPKLSVPPSAQHGRRRECDDGGGTAE